MKHTQTTLDHFFQTKGHKVKNIFYIDWSTKPPVTQWLSEQPSDTTFDATIQWKALRSTITICCGGTPSLQVEPRRTRGTSDCVSLLKSMLQKCVRRQQTDLSLRIGWHLLQIDLEAFLRRLFVIMLEDVRLHPSASVIVWLTSAVSKGYQVTVSQIDWLLGVVKMLCEDSQKEFRDAYSMIPPNPKMLWTSIERASIAPDVSDLLRSIVFRSSYGGMKPDLAMFGYYVQRYLTEKCSPSSFPIDPIDHTILEDLPRSSLPLYGVDFHCFPAIVTLIQTKFPQLTESQIHECIWECNSKTNTRWNSPINPSITDTWSLIETEVHHLQRLFLLRK